MATTRGSNLVLLKNILETWEANVIEKKIQKEGSSLLEDP